METEQAQTNLPISEQVRYGYFIDCHTYAREELFFRLRERSRFLNLHLLVQVTVLALAFGVQLGAFKAPGGEAASMLAFPLVLVLAVPSSFIFATLYAIEDYLVDYASRHLGNLSRCEYSISRASFKIRNFDHAMARQFAITTIPIRFQAQLVAFVGVPALLVGFRFFNIGVHNLTYYNFLEAGADLLLLAVVAVRLTTLYRYRQRPIEPDTAPSAPTPHEG